MIIDFTSKSKNEYSTSLCLKGTNSSGKTNAIKVLSFLSHFCRNSFEQKPDTEILFDTFFNNTNQSEYFIDFKVGDIEYSYEAVLTKKNVLSEKIYKKEQGKTLVLHRKNSIIEKNSLFNSRQEFPLRNNASIISTAHQYEIEEFIPIYNFFDSIICNVSYLGLSSLKYNNSQLAEIYSKNAEMLHFVRKELARFDTGVNDVKIESYINENKVKIYFPVFSQKTDLTNENNLLFDVQSSGTKSLYHTLYFYFVTLNKGGVLCLDEFDINLHPDILPHLIELFLDKRINKKNAQLIFSTHNTEIIDMMGKYRTYFFNKENGESYCYRLDELNGKILSNDRQISSLYREHKIGGVPKIESENE
jgi:AAA15 family ATPase/GTPase